MVRDASGAVLPGVTVEAASPVLIEKVRSVLSDSTGQYRIVDLRPGTYAVTFTLPGFTTVKRDGIELTGDFVASVNADLRVGSLEETVTVTGESPIVDVQSARVQTMLDRDVLTAIPSSRGANGIQALVPGLTVGLTNGDSGGITGGSGGMAGFIHGARASDSRTLHDGINTGWAGANSNAAVSNVAGAQETVLTTSGGLGEAETGGVILNVIPRDGGNNFSGTVFLSGANGAMQGSNYTDALKAAGLRSPQELKKVYDFNPMGGGRIIRDKLWFYLTYREVVAENTVPGMFFNRNAGDPTKWLVDFDTSRPAFVDSVTRNAVAPAHVAGHAAQQDQPEPLRAVRPAEQDRRRQRHADAGSAGHAALYARPHPAGDVDVSLHQPAAVRGRLGRLPVALRQLRAARRRLAQRPHDLRRRTVLAELSQQQRLPGRPQHPRHCRPDLSLQPAAAAGVRAPSDRHAGADARGGVVHSRLAQREGGLPGQHQPPEPGVFQLHAVHSVPVQQRRAQSAESDAPSTPAR